MKELTLILGLFEFIVARLEKIQQRAFAKEDRLVAQQAEVEAKYQNEMLTLETATEEVRAAAIRAISVQRNIRRIIED